MTEKSFKKLPPYAQSLLQIEVPVIATLASTKQTVDEITAWGPGTIIQFDKSCEGLLELSAGGQQIASGEAVKVGETFGIRISEITLPEERFKAVKK